MDERLPAAGREDEINLGKYFWALRREWRKIVLLSLAAGVVTFLVSLMFPNVYRASAVIAPPPQERKEMPALGMLATLGVNLGAATRIEDLESLFRSNDLTVRVFKKHSFWPILCKGRYDSRTGKIRRSLASRLFRGKEPDVPGDWDAIRAARTRLKVIVNRRAGILSVSFESPSPQGSAEIVRQYLEEGKSRLQEEALDRAALNKKFIEEQIGKTVDALTRDRLYTLYSQEMEQEMMARNREQFGFRVIDSPRAPDRKTKPQRGLIALLATLFAGVLFSAYFIVRNKCKHSAEQTGDM